MVSVIVAAMVSNVSLHLSAILPFVRFFPPPLKPTYLLAKLQISLHVTQLSDPSRTSAGKLYGCSDPKIRVAIH